MPDASAPPPCPASPPLRQRRKAARPQELLDAALQLFVTKGFAATRMDDVAHRAGVSKGTLYLYYASKDELFKAVVRNSLGLVIAQGSEMVDAWEGSTSDLLHQLAHTWWSQVGSFEVSGLFKLVIAEVGNLPELAQFYVDEVISPTHELLGKAVTRGVERGEFRALNVNDVVHALVAPAQFLALYQHCTARSTCNPYPLNTDTFMTTQIELLLRGLEINPQPKLGGDQA
jgi:TetR/AcrR family transcriptional regulator